MKRLEDLEQDIEKLETTKKLEKLERDVKKLWNHILILACICAFTELCDLIELLIGGN